MYEHMIKYVVKLKSFSETALEEAENQSQMEQLAFYDSLTGLKNRGCFEKDCEQYLPQNMTVIFIDANGLKAMNDTYGHQMGDELLKCISTSIQKVWSKEYAYRVGGDEFWIMLQNVDDDAVGEAIQSFKHILDNSNVDGMAVSVAIGVARGNPDKTMEQLITEADQDMYKDKRHYKATCATGNVPTVGTKSEPKKQSRDMNDFMIASDIIRCGMSLLVLVLIYWVFN